MDSELTVKEMQAALANVPGSVLQHVIAHGGLTVPPLFSAAMASSTYLPSQYAYNSAIPEVSIRSPLTDLP